MNQIELNENEALVVIIRHPKHNNNVIPSEEAERVVKQGRRLLKLGLKPDQIASVIASIRGRSQETARLLLQGLSTEIPITVSYTYDALDEIGPKAKEFKAAAVTAGMKPWEALAERRGAKLCLQFGIADRLVRATQFWTVCQTTAQIVGSGKAVVVSGHNGNGIEIALELAHEQADFRTPRTSASLPNPTHYVKEAGIILVYIDTETGLLSTRDTPIVYLDAD